MIETNTAVLSARRAAILKTVIEEYVGSGAPVGSATVIRRVPLGVSTATIRNDMAALASDGYISQPHTSAGRIPEDRGWRYFVDHFAAIDCLSAGDRSVIATFFREASVELDHLLAATSRLLAQLTHLAAVVVTPMMEDMTLADLHLTQLASGRILVVLITRTGRVAKVVAEGDGDVAEAVLAAAERHLRKMLVGTHDWTWRRRVLEIPDPDVATIVRRILDALARSDRAPADVFLDGASELAERIDEVATLRAMLNVLDQRRALVDALSAVVLAAPSTPIVQIGSEISIGGFRDASVVLTSYRSGQSIGLVGLVGPVRMDYTRAMSAVQYVSEQLECALEG